MKKRGLRRDENAQMGIDFLVGMSVFLSALAFLALFIPGMFLSFQSETIDLNSVAYRTSVILVEDPGWWDNEVEGGEDWENQNIEDVSRVGLAIDKEHPNTLALHKIGAFSDEIFMDNNNLGDKLGLYRKIGDNKIEYGYSITMEDLKGNVLVARGTTTPEYGGVSSMKRTVIAQTDSVYDLVGLKSMFPHQDDKADFSVASPEDDLRLIIRNIEVQNPPNHPQLNYIKINGFQVDLGEDYCVWIDNGTGEFELQDTTPIDLPEEPYNTTSRLKIVIDKDAFVDEEAFFGDGKHLVEIKFTSVRAEVGIADLDDMDETIIYEPAILRVNIW